MTTEGVSTIVPAVSVVIPALNEEKTIGRCLEALCHMDCGAQDFEVILADNGSQDSTVEIARSYMGRLHLRIIQRPGVYISALRNAAAKLAEGTALAFLDADCVPPPTWIAGILSHLRAMPNAVIGAHYMIPRDSSWIANAWYGRDPGKIGIVNYVPGGDLIVAREDFTALGGFDESIQTNEDAEFCRRARLRGLNVVAFQQLAVEHLGTPQTLSAFFRKQHWQGTHVFKIFLRERGSQNARPVALAAYTIITFLAAIVGIVLRVTGQQYHLLTFSVVALIAAPVVIGTQMAVRRKRIADAAILALLTLVYAFARSLCLLDIRTWLYERRTF